MDRHQRDQPVPSLNPVPLRYAISDGQAHQAPQARLLTALDVAAAAGADAFQIREKDLSAHALADLCRQAAEHRRRRGYRLRLLVNGRFDVALAAGLDGLHLPANGLPGARLRALAPPGFLLAQSCHSAADVQAAAGQSLDFCVLGPIFPTPSKLQYGHALGLEALAAASGFGLPVLALGGITAGNAPACLAAGAAGLAGIRWFAHPSAPSEPERR